MNNENTNRRRVALEIFEAVFDAPPAKKPGILRNRCGNDEDLRGQVEKMLAAASADPNFLEDLIFEDSSHIFEQEPGDDMVGKVFGKYVLRELIGQGGMGKVYLGERNDREFERKVAVKIISPIFAGKTDSENFRRERLILAKLNHPAIAALLDSGTTRKGELYLVMEYVKGVSLTEYCALRSLSIKERLNLFLEVCGAVKFAHQNLIVHRDLKPANILVTDEGKPKLLDFGVAKLLQPELFDISTDFTIGGNILTPNYASPEQLKGENITTASDVYSLGVILYEMLTGRRPHDLKSKSLPEILKTITEEVPRLPSESLNREAEKRGRREEEQIVKSEISSSPHAVFSSSQLRGDLDTIALKALAKDPNERYQTVEALTDDINRYLNYLPIRARKPSAIYRFKKFARRNKIAFVSACVITLLLLSLLGLAVWSARVSAKQARENLRQAYSSDMNLAMESFETANLTRLNQILERYEATDLRGWEWNFLQNLANPKGKLLTLKHPSDVWRVTFSPDSKRFATAAGDGFARIYAVPSGNLVATTNVPEKNIWQLKFSPDGRLLATASGDSNSTSARIWNAETGAEILSLIGHTARVRAIDYSPDGSLLATGSRDGTIRVWSAATGAELKKFAVTDSGETLETHDLKFTPDGTKLVTANSHGAAVVDAVSGKILLRLVDPPCLSVAVSPDGSQFAVGRQNAIVQIYDLKTGEMRLEIAKHTAKINAVAFSPDGKLLASASSDRTVRFFETDKGLELQNLRVHFADAWSVAFSPDGKFIATAGTDFNAFLFDATRITASSSVGRAASAARDWSVISPDGKTMATNGIGNASSNTIFDVEIKTSRFIFSNDGIYAGAFSPDNKILATGMLNGEIVFWNVVTGQEIRRFAAYKKLSTGSGIFKFLFFSPDGHLLLSGGKDNDVKIWNALSGELIRRLRGFESPASALAISPDSRRAFAAGFNQTAKLYDLETGEMIADLGTQPKAILSASYAPDGKVFVTGGADGIIKIWNADGKLLDTLTGNAGFIWALAFTPDDKRLASASGEGVIRLWDTETKAQVLAIRTNSATTNYLAFTPDGNTLVSHGSQERIRFWDATPVER